MKLFIYNITRMWIMLGIYLKLQKWTFHLSISHCSRGGRSRKHPTRLYFKLSNFFSISHCSWRERGQASILHVYTFKNFQGPGCWFDPPIFSFDWHQSLRETEKLVPTASLSTEQVSISLPVYAAYTYILLKTGAVIKTVKTPLLDDS